MIEDQTVEPSTPLLLHSASPEPECTKDMSNHQDSQDTQYQGWQPTLSKLIEEIKMLHTIAFPMIITGLLVYGKAVISVLFMGRVGKEALAGGSLAMGFANITGYSIITGLAVGMEGITSQAFGAKQWTLIDQTLQRTIAILVSACIPISLLWLNAEPILLHCGQNPTISSIASTYLTFGLPDLLLQSFINPLRIYLRGQNITLPLILSAAFALVLHVPINYVLVYPLDLGIRGVAMGVALADFNLLVFLLLYLYFSGIYRKPWQGWSLECFDKWKPILALAFPSCVSVCLEWWWYEIMIILAGLLQNATETVATMGILIQATALVYIFPSSLSQAVTTRVGNELGAKQPHKAKTSFLVALLCAFFMSFIALFFMKTMPNAWGKLFTKDIATLSLIGLVMPVVGLCELGNCPQTVVCGVIRGIATPALGANINLASFYVVGLPIAVLNGFAMKMGLVGLWLGLLAAQIVCAFVKVVVLLRTDWIIQANRARELTDTDMDNHC